MTDSSVKTDVYNVLTATYDTPDGTKVAAEIVNNVHCLADVLHICDIRQKQRDAKKSNPIAI